MHSSSKHWMSNTTVKDTIFSTKLILRFKQPRIIRLGLGSDTGKDPEAALSSKTRRNPVWSFSDNLSNVFKADELGLEIAYIALPAVIALAADPLSSLVDTAFVGQIGPVELAAVGVSISVFNLVSKMFNIPLLNVTTSFVAEDASEKSSGVNTKSQEPESTPLLNAQYRKLVTMKLMTSNMCPSKFYIYTWEELGLLSSSSIATFSPNHTVLSTSVAQILSFTVVKILKEKRFLLAISSALVLGTALGVGEAIVLAFLAGPVLIAMGVGAVRFWTLGDHDLEKICIIRNGFVSITSSIPFVDQFQSATATVSLKVTNTAEMGKENSTSKSMSSSYTIKEVGPRKEVTVEVSGAVANA